MKNLTTKRGLRCAIYTRVSTDQGLEQDFNSLDAQREASEAYIKSQAHEGGRLVRGFRADSACRLEEAATANSAGDEVGALIISPSTRRWNGSCPKEFPTMRV